MISRALFIIVAESMVILGPIDHVGCSRASATVTCCSSPGDMCLNGPPLAVRISRSTSRGWPALQGLEQRAVLAVDGQQLAAGLAGQLRHQVAGHDQRFFVRQGDGFLAFERGPGAFEPGAADDGGQHHVDAVGAGDLAPGRRGP